MKKSDWRKNRYRPAETHIKILEGIELTNFLVALNAEKESSAVHFIKFLLLGDWGMSRTTELLHLKWEEIDFERGCIRICLPPNKKNVTVILGSAIDEPTTNFLQELSLSRQEDCRWVFPTSPGRNLLTEVRSVLRRVSKRVGIEGVGLKVLKES